MIWNAISFTVFALLSICVGATVCFLTLHLAGRAGKALGWWR